MCSLAGLAECDARLSRMAFFSRFCCCDFPKRHIIQIDDTKVYKAVHDFCSITSLFSHFFLSLFTGYWRMAVKKKIPQRFIFKPDIKKLCGQWRYLLSAFGDIYSLLLEISTLSFWGPTRAFFSCLFHWNSCLSCLNENLTLFIGFSVDPLWGTDGIQVPRLQRQTTGVWHINTTM